jgi:membrane-bound serine protease (ClpP class)
MHPVIEAYITNPNITYLLLLIGFYALFFEITHPGLFIPGITGILSLILVVYAFQALPVDYFGLMLIILGIGFMMVEAYATTYGIIGLFGVIAFILGSVLLFDINDPHYHISIPLILAMSLISFTVFFIILTLAIQSYKRKVVAGSEGLIGSDGVVISVINEQILVRVMGEIWSAKTSDRVKPGDKIEVTQVHGLMLTIKLSKNNKEQSGD